MFFNNVKILEARPYVCGLRVLIPHQPPPIGMPAIAGIEGVVAIMAGDGAIMVDIACPVPWAAPDMGAIPMLEPLVA